MAMSFIRLRFLCLALLAIVPTCESFSFVHPMVSLALMQQQQQLSVACTKMRRLCCNLNENESVAHDVSNDDNAILCPPISTAPSSSSTMSCVLAMGWFWGPQLYFSQLDGIVRAVVGYSGGVEEGNPCYHNILDSSEAILLEYDPQKLSYADILKIVRMVLFFVHTRNAQFSVWARTCGFSWNLCVCLHVHILFYTLQVLLYSQLSTVYSLLQLLLYYDPKSGLPSMPSFGPNPPNDSIDISCLSRRRRSEPWPRPRFERWNKPLRFTLV